MEKNQIRYLIRLEIVDENQEKRPDIGVDQWQINGCDALTQEIDSHGPIYGSTLAVFYNLLTADSAEPDRRRRKLWENASTGSR